MFFVGKKSMKYLKAVIGSSYNGGGTLATLNPVFPNFLVVFFAIFISSLNEMKVWVLKWV